MGACGSQPEKKLQKQIDNSLKIARQRSIATFRLLLLGTGGAGKSTLFKQLAAIYTGGLPTEKRVALVPTINAAVVHGMQSLIQDSEPLTLEKEDAEAILKIDVSQLTGSLSLETASQIERLWLSNPIQRTYQKRLNLSTDESLSYFFENLDQITRADYIPSDEDTIRLNQPTIVVDNLDFSADGFNFSLVDVGGQRNDRKKWFHCFEGTQGVLFVVSLADFDVDVPSEQSGPHLNHRHSFKDFESLTSNRMMDALHAFREVCHTAQLKHSAIILLFNKSERFRAKLQTTSLAATFPGYSGPNDFARCYQYIKSEFLAVAGSRPISVFCVEATDKELVKDCMDLALDIIMQNNLRNSGFM